MLRALPVVLVLAVLSLAVAAVPAHAVLITVNFTVQADAGDPVDPNATANGNFTFDSSLIPVSGNGSVGGVVDTSERASSISFTWAGTTWTTANATVNELSFTNGQLMGWGFHGDLDPSGIFGISALDGVPDIDLGPFSFNAYDHSLSAQVYHFRNLSWTVDYGTSGAPEPASWLLLCGALVGLVGVRQRARK